MSISPLIGLAGVVALLAALTAGIPIGVALGVVGMGGLILILGVEPALIKSGVILFETLSRYELGVLPLFLLMAHVSFAAGASRDFFDAAIADLQVAFAADAFVDHDGVLDERGLGHRNLSQTSGYRVVSAGTERMAASDSFYRQPAAAQRAVAGNGFRRVL